MSIYHWFKRGALIFTLCIFPSCGGGSSSSGSSDYGVRVLHGSLDGAPVVLYHQSDGRELQRVRFGQGGNFVRLQQGDQSLLATVASDSVSIEFLYSEGERRTILLFGNTLQAGPRFNYIVDESYIVEEGMAAVRIINAVTGTAGIEAVINDLAPIKNAEIGTASQYYTVSAGTVGYSVKEAEGSALISQGVLELEAGKAYTLFVAGEAGYFVVARLLMDY